jgi:hypothetical protein
MEWDGWKIARERGSGQMGDDGSLAGPDKLDHLERVNEERLERRYEPDKNITNILKFIKMLLNVCGLMFRNLPLQYSKLILLDE